MVGHKGQSDVGMDRPTLPLFCYLFAIWGRETRKMLP